MRIISGSFKGRRLTPPKGVDIRPTTDQAREALFNILANRVDLSECEVLDLFSGTGAVSLEFVSRGAKYVTAIELAPRAVKAIRQRCIEWDVENLDVIQADAFRFISRGMRSFDLVFADPPYDHPNILRIPELVFQNNLLENEGLLILEHSKVHDFEDYEGFVETRKYGHVRMSIFEFTQD